MRIRSVSEINKALKIIEAYRNAIIKKNYKAIVNIIKKSFYYSTFFKEKESKQFIELHALAIELLNN